MTEQERFERFQANEIRMDYDEFKRRFDEHERITGERYGKGGQFHKEWKIWDKAAQQKEGYVLVPVDQAKDTQRIDWLADKNQNIGNVMLPTVCVEQNLHSLRGAIDMAMQMEQVND